MDKQTINENLKFYKLYKILPNICFIVIAILYSIWGAIDASIFIKQTGEYYTSYYDFSSKINCIYGLFGFDTWLGCCLFWIVVGLIFATVVYFVMKVKMSVSTLQTEYLALLAKEKTE